MRTFYFSFHFSFFLLQILRVGMLCSASLPIKNIFQIDFRKTDKNLSTDGHLKLEDAPICHNKH